MGVSSRRAGSMRSWAMGRSHRRSACRSWSSGTTAGRGRGWSDERRRGTTSPRHANVTVPRDDERVNNAVALNAAAPRTTTGPWRDAVAGVAATALALGVSELLGGLLPGATSLVASIGQVIIDN